MLRGKQTYILNKSVSPEPQEIIRYSKGKIVSIFINPKVFRNKWQKATWKTGLLKELRKHNVFLNVIRKEHPKLQKYDYFDMIMYLAYGQKPLTKRERVNHVRKQGLPKYRGAAKEILDELLDEYQNNSKFNVNNLESLKSLNKLGGVVNIINNDFHGANNYFNAIHDIENILYSAK